MTNTIDFILTAAASDLMSKAISGKTLNFTRMAVGDGFSYDKTIAKDYKALVNEVLSLDITKKETVSASSVRITSAFKNTDAQKEFYYREVGLYAQDPDTGKEILYAYGNRNDAAELITPAGSNVVTKQLVFIIAVGDSAKVTFNVNADVYALQEDMLNVQENKADKNLANTGMITNCLLEVPQRIKLELNNGVLILKAGSVVTKPNGEQKVIESDISYKPEWLNGLMIILYDGDQNTISYSTSMDWCFSGNTAPSDIDEGTWWLDTSNKIFKRYTNEKWEERSNFYLPLGIASVTTSGAISINQVFNGMGYFGSTIWIDKGIKCLIPNGRNSDGTLKNLMSTSKGLFAYTFSDSNFNGEYLISLVDSTSTGFHALGIEPKNSIFYQNEKPEEANKWWFHIEENQWKYTLENGSTTNYWWADMCECKLKNGIITSFRPYAPFKVINRLTDKAWLSSLALPSEKFIDYELGERGTTYAAPANGWFAIRKDPGFINAQVSLAVWDTSETFEYFRTTMSSPAEGIQIAFFVPILKGQKLAVDYDATGLTLYFRFIYAQGEVN